MRGIRVVKHLGSRSCPADDSKVLMAVPTFPGERIVAANISGYFASGDDESIDQPSELNWYGITVPWSLVFTQLMNTDGGAVEDIGDVSDFDNTFKLWLRGSEDDQYYGGDVDADPDSTPADETDRQEALIDSGPIGVSTFFSREVVMQPMAAEGNNVIRFGDSYYTQLRKFRAPSMGGLSLFGIIRFEHAAETNFNVELDDATSKEAMGMLISGDYTRALAMVEGNTGSIGDYLRTVLYGGDNYIEADTLKGAAGKGTVKASFAIQTSLGRLHA